MPSRSCSVNGNRQTDTDDARQEVYNLAINSFLALPEVQQANCMAGMPLEKVERLLAIARAMATENTSTRRAC